MEIALLIFYVVLLAAMIAYPVHRWIWTLGVRSLQRNLGRELTEAELAEQKRRAWRLTAVICPVFSFLFNLSTVGWPQ
ncbi:MAG: hypothetical protein ACLFSI_05235 [Halorhodospira sp.]